MRIELDITRRPVPPPRPCEDESDNEYRDRIFDWEQRLSHCDQFKCSMMDLDHMQRKTCLSPAFARNDADATQATLKSLMEFVAEALASHWTDLNT